MLAHLTMVGAALVAIGLAAVVVPARLASAIDRVQALRTQ
jgi:ABC-type antimicrobial peptide transport system permease subunit